MTKEKHLAGFIGALVFNLIPVHAGAEELRLYLRSINGASLIEKVLLDVKVEYKGENLSYWENSYYTVETPIDENINITDEKNRFVPRSIVFLSKKDPRKPCSSRYIYMMSEKPQFNFHAFATMKSKLTSSACREVDAALVWFRYWYYQSTNWNLVASPGVANMGRNKLLKLAKNISYNYAVALHNACKILRYEAACRESISHSKKLISEFRRNPNLRVILSVGKNQAQFMRKSARAVLTAYGK